jgi:hypothetical protein
MSAPVDQAALSVLMGSCQVRQSASASRAQQVQLELEGSATPCVKQGRPPTQCGQRVPAVRMARPVRTVQHALHAPIDSGRMAQTAYKPGMASSPFQIDQASYHALMARLASQGSAPPVILDRWLPTIRPHVNRANGSGTILVAKAALCVMQQAHRTASREQLFASSAPCGLWLQATRGMQTPTGRHVICLQFAVALVKNQIQMLLAALTVQLLVII